MSRTDKLIAAGLVLAWALILWSARSLVKDPPIPPLDLCPPHGIGSPWCPR